MAEAAKNILSRVDFLQLIPHNCPIVFSILPTFEHIGGKIVKATLPLGSFFGESQRFQTRASVEWFVGRYQEASQSPLASCLVHLTPLFADSVHAVPLCGPAELSPHEQALSDATLGY